MAQGSEEKNLRQSTEQCCSNSAKHHGQEVQSGMLRPTRLPLGDQGARQQRTQHVKTAVGKIDNAGDAKHQRQARSHDEQGACVAQAIQALNQPKTHSIQCVKELGSMRVVLKVLTKAASSA